MDKGGRVVGMLVFALGIVVLLLVLWIAYGMFSTPASAFLHAGGAGKGSLTASGLGVTVVWIFVKIALLFVMTLAASLIASRGIQLYLGSKTHV
jgi:hypothetical protein